MPAAGIAKSALICALVSHFGVDDARGFFKEELGLCPPTSAFYEKRMRKPPKKRGKKSWWTEARDLRLANIVHSIQSRPGHIGEVTSSILKEKLKCPLSNSAIRKRCCFLGLRTWTPVRMDDPAKGDDEARLKFCRSRVGKPLEFFGNALHLDGKIWRYASSLHKKLQLLRGRCRFVRCLRGGRSNFPRPNPRNVLNTAPVKFLAGVIPFRRFRCDGGRGPVVMWARYVKYNSETFRQMVEPVLKKFRIKTVFMDWHKVHQGGSTKKWMAEAGVTTIFTPKRSPCLAICDFALWAAVQKRMENDSGLKVVKESVSEFAKRVAAAAFSLPTSVTRGFVSGSEKGMKARIRYLARNSGVPSKSW